MNEETVFAEAIAIESAEERSKFLDSACSDNRELRQAVEKLLRLANNAGSFLEHPALEGQAAALHALDATIVHCSGSTCDNENDANISEQPAMRKTPQDPDDEIPLGYLQPSTRPDSLGRLDHYEVLEVLGRGAFGIVLKAFDEKLHRVVAIKVLSAEMASTSPARKRFLREARASAQIRHEHVVSIYAVDEEPLPFLVMEYIPGETLQHRLDSHGPLDVPDVLRLGKQIASGLAAAHAQQLIHRDIKPGNILLETSVDDHVKITDFGLARTTDDASVTQSGLIAGTPMYMAPEQVLGQQLDHRTDLFSFGSVLYQMVSGRPPFRAPTTVAVLKRVAEDMPRPIQEIIPETPAWLCEIIRKLHAKSADERYTSAKEVADLLERCQSELQQGRVPQFVATKPPAPPVLPDPPKPAAPRGAKRPPAPLMAAAAAALVLLIGLSITEATGVTKLAATAIRLSTGSGTLVIETDDPTVQVAINGEEVTIRGAGVEELTLRPGQYRIAALKDGKPVKQELVTISRDGRTVVRMFLESGGALQAIAPAAELVPWPADAPPLAIAPFDAAQAKQHQQAWANYLGVPVEKEVVVGQDRDGQDVTLAMVLIPPGGFLMGSLDQERARFQEEVKANDDPAAIDRIRGEGPQHRVRITRPFYLGECELTQAQWLAVMGTNPSRFQDAPTRPVEMVSWDDVQGYLAKLNEGASAGALTFALPTEAQWEYACRAGTATPYCSGENAVDLRPYGWFDANSGGQTHPVGELKRNAFGLCDMHGNVFEWCADSFSENYYSNSPEDDPPGPATGSDHVRRGGSWARSAARCRSAARSNLRSSDIHFSLVGFRVAAALPEAVLRAKLSANATSSDPKSSQFQWPADAPPLAIAPLDGAQAKAHQEAWANYLGVPVEYTNSIGMKFTLIPPTRSADGPEEPIYAGTYEVTVGQYRRFAKETGTKSKAEESQLGGYWVQGVDQNRVGTPSPEYIWSHSSLAPTDDHPVGMMTWHDARAFCEWLSRTDGPAYRLPKVAEWEWAASGGRKERFYFGDDLSQLGEHAWYLANSERTTHPVGLKNANPWGLYDVYGNIFELCAEWTTNHRDLLSVTEVPSGPPTSAYQIVRGGSYHDATSGGGGRISGKAPYSHVGFRVVMPATAVAEAIKRRDAATESSTSVQWPADAPPLAIAPFDAEQAKIHQEAWAKYLGVPVEKEIVLGQDKDGKDVSLTMILIPPGEFMMGSTNEEQARYLIPAAGDSDLWGVDMIRSEGPQHRIRITRPYYLAKHEVTQGQWLVVMSSNPSRFQDGPQHPVDRVSADEVQPFLTALNDTTPEQGLVFSLPTEAQWEFACRAGTTAVYSFGDSDDSLGKFAWNGANSDRRTHPVGQLPPNGFGLYDMHGNVWEWCSDRFEQDYYLNSPTDDPYCVSGSSQVYRGGGCYARGRFCRSAHRRAFREPADRLDDLGFRLAAVLPDELSSVKLSSIDGERVANTPGSNQNSWPADAPPPAIAPFDTEQAKAHQEAWAKYLGVPVEYTNSIGMKFRLVPPGEFLMGSAPEEIEAALVVAGEDQAWRERINGEGPQHEVVLTQPVYVGVTEVTQGQYEQVMGTNPSYFAPSGEGKEAVAGLENGDHPVEMVSWNDAAEFCARLSQREELKPFYSRSGETVAPLEGTGYRLPTEAEWECACRAGTTTRFWSGDQDNDLIPAGWFGRPSGGRTRAVGELRSNPFGLFDVHGNVWEWVQDKWDLAFYARFKENPAAASYNPIDGVSQRVIRGGDWGVSPTDCRSSGRSAGEATYRAHAIGFRVVLPVDAIKQRLPGKPEAR